MLILFAIVTIFAHQLLCGAAVANTTAGECAGVEKEASLNLNFTQVMPVAAVGTFATSPLRVET